MVEKEFTTKYGYLHIPVHSGEGDSFLYIEVFGDNVFKNEFLIGISAPGERVDYYVAMDVKRYGCEKATLICREDQVSERLFDGIIEGGPIEEEKVLYPNLYREEIRQQIHFSPKCGWMNDPNGLFYKDGVFHMYFQHNPFSNHHYCTNVSWGHATSTDRIHFKEHGDAIMPKNSYVSIASGSAIVDKYNISGLGENTVLAAYTDLISRQWRGRPEVKEGEGQNLLYSLDNGMTFHFFANNPIIQVPAGEGWRDPKIIQLDDKTFCIAVYERYEEKNCISFYRSNDCVNWVFCSRCMDLYECPDLFPLRVKETDEELWILYGGSGKYKIGQFKNFRFEAIGEEGYMDYGNCVYAGQTFNNYEDPYVRLHMAWLRDTDHKWWYEEGEPWQEYGFSQSMTFMCELSLHKTENGYRLFRTPIEEMERLRQSSESVAIEKEYMLPVPGEVIFRIDGTKDFRLMVGGEGFSYDALSREFVTTSGKKILAPCTIGYEVRIFTDTRSVEIFIEDQISMSFFVRTKQKQMQLEGQNAINARVYTLKSIWEDTF